MAEDASERLTSLTGSVSSLQLSSLLFPKFDRKTELLSYLILCVSKMPFIPPVSLARSVSGLSEREKLAGGPSPAPPAPAPAPPPPAKARVPKEDRGGSVTERLALNLKQLRRKSPAPSQLPTARGAKGGELHAKRKEHSLPSKTRSDGLPASSSGESLSKAAPQRKPLETEARGGGGGGGGGGVPRRPEEARFTLTLTPEAVLLLQRRNNERNQRSAASAEARRRRDNPSKRHQVQRHATPNGRTVAAVGAPAKSPSQAKLRDVSSFVKISLLNEQHKYDDVEYEEQEAQGVDERVVLKCTEWLRGLESTPVTVRSSLSRGATVKTF